MTLALFDSRANLDRQGEVRRQPTLPPPPVHLSCREEALLRYSKKSSEERVSSTERKNATSEPAAGCAGRLEGTLGEAFAGEVEAMSDEIRQREND